MTALQIRSDAGPLAANADSTADAEPQRLHLVMPIDVRSVSLAVIALVVSLYALQWAREILIPILFGVMASYALTPIVERLERLKVPRAAGATVVLTAIVVLVCWGVWALRDQANALLDTAPAVTQKIRELSRHANGRPTAIEKVQNAASELAAAAVEAAPGSAPDAAASAQAPRAQPAKAQAQPAPAQPAFDVRAFLLSGTIGFLSLLGSLAIVYFVALFLMSSGNAFRRKMVKLAGPKLSQKRVTIETLDEITLHIQRYLLVQVGVSVAVGVCTWLAFWALDLHNAGVWGVVAGITNMIPYVGAVLVGGAAAVVALVQFGTPGMALVVAAASFGIHTVLGNVLTPLWMGRASKMSPLAVFIAILGFGWLWGVSGLLLGVPILLVVKSVCDRIEDLKPVGELLGQ